MILFLVLVSLKHLCLASGLSVYSASLCHTVFYGEAAAQVLLRGTGALGQAVLLAYRRSELLPLSTHSADFAAAAAPLAVAGVHVVAASFSGACAP